MGQCTHLPTRGGESVGRLHGTPPCRGEGLPTKHGAVVLGRTAQNLFWLSPLCRAGREHGADARGRVSHEPHLAARGRGQRASDLDDAGGRGRRGLHAKHKMADVATVADFMLFDEENPSSVRSCLRAARTNARSVRTALTTEVWETINAGWLEFVQMSSRSDIAGSGLQETAALGQAGQPPVPRRVPLDHPPRRRLRLQPARQLRRAGRQHGAHPRHEVLRAAAARDAGRRRRRHPAMDADPARRLGASQLPARLSRPLQGLEHRRLPDPPAGNAALADLLHRLDQPHARHARGDLWRRGRRPRCGRRGDRRCSRATTWTASSSTGCTSS